MALESRRRREELALGALVLLSGLLALALAQRHVTVRDAERVHQLALSEHARVEAAAGQPVQHARAPADHLPLRGMAGFTGDTAKACERLEGFLIAALRQLQGAGHATPYRPHQVPTRLAGSACAVDDPALGPVLTDLDAAWRAARLPPVGPLGSE